MFIYQLLRPFSYLNIDYKGKWKLDWLGPLLAALITTILLVGVGFIKPLSILGDNGLIDKLTALLETLPGFYIAALAAIATFNRIDIDRIMPSPPPKINIFIRGKTVPIELTRRRFLCILLAFLTAESLILLVSGIFAQTVSSSIKELFYIKWHSLILYSFLFVYLIFFWQLIVVTFFGLFYLGDRIHQPDDSAE